MVSRTTVPSPGKVAAAAVCGASATIVAMSDTTYVICVCIRRYGSIHQQSIITADVQRADCDKPVVNSKFFGECNNCGERGHRVSCSSSVLRLAGKNHSS